MQTNPLENLLVHEVTIYEKYTIHIISNKSFLMCDKFTDCVKVYIYVYKES
jgi:hypothetical protein